MKPVSRQLAWQRRKLAQGLCCICGRFPLETKRHCRIHAQKNREAARRNSLTKREKSC